MYRDPIEELIDLINGLVSDKDSDQKTLIKLDNNILLDLDRLLRMNRDIFKINQDILKVLKEINGKLTPNNVAVSATIKFGTPTNN